LAQCPITIPFTHTHTHRVEHSQLFSFFTFNATSTSLTDFDCKVKSGRRTDKVNCDFGQKKEKKKKKTFLFILSVAKVRPKKKIRVKKDASNVERKVEIKMFCVFDMLSGPKSYNLTSLSFLHFVCVKRLQQVLPQKHSISNANRRGSGEGVRAHIHNLQKNTCFT